MEGRDIFSPVNSLSIFFAVSTRSILDGCENSCGNIHVVHLLCHATEESLSKKLTSLDSYWGQLKLAKENITNCKDVRNVGFLNIICLNLSV